jgi:hypothetical protein
MDISPEDRQRAKDALAYLTSLVHREPGDTTSGAALLRSLVADGSSLEDLLAGMGTLVSMLVFMRLRDVQIHPEDTLRELGEDLTKGE